MSADVLLVTDAEARAALATTRSLGAAGFEVHVCSSHARSLAGASRFAAGEHRLPDAIRDPDAWAREIEALAERIGACGVLPVGEVSLGTAFARGLDDRLPLFAPSREAYESVVDKYALGERARLLGFRVPPTHLANTPAELAALESEVKFPTVLRARRSWFLDEGGWRQGPTRILRGPTELAQAAQDPGYRGGAILQEYIPGHGEGLFLLASAGRLRVRFAHRRLREKPPSGGVSTLCESVRLDPELLAAGERLLADLAWDGVAMLEFRRPREGQAFLMEVNPRLWGSLQLAIDAGVDFPRLWVRMRRGEDLGPVEPRPGVRSRWLLGDLDHLLICLRRPDVRAATGRSAAGVLRDFVRSFLDGSRLDVLRAGDRRPFLRELRAWLG